MLKRLWSRDNAIHITLSQSLTNLWLIFQNSHIFKTRTTCIILHKRAQISDDAVFKKLPSSDYRQLLSYPLLWWILGETTNFWQFCANFWENHPCLRKIWRKRDGLFGEFWTQKPTHMGGTFPYPQHVMLPAGVISSHRIFCFSFSKQFCSSLLFLLYFLTYLSMFC